MPQKKNRALDDEALQMHEEARGKIEINLKVPLTTQRDLSLAYSPGVGAPCLKIADNPDDSYKYTTRGNMVAVISNGTAVLGLGDLGALASKPVMEGKAALFKRFADVDSIDLEVDTKDVDEFVNAVRYLGPSFGGINLEDIKAPECFMIEEKLKELMDIPVFHDDQHGTAIITAAGVINALEITGRKIEKTKFVFNGAGAASIACLELILSMGVKPENAITCDKTGVIYKGRNEGMNPWKEKHAVETKARTLEDAVKGADVFIGLSAAGALTPKMVKGMAKNPIIFAMANPVPEILPEEAKKVRPDAIVATGRSDYPNQVNNVLGFPYIFRGALDVHATTINEEMKMAAAKAIAGLAKEDVPDEVSAAYSGSRLQFGPDYFIPVPFDPRLISHIPAAVAKAAMDTGVARKPIQNFRAYKQELSARLDPTAGTMQLIAEHVQANPKRVVFAEGEEEKAIRAALNYQNSGYGQAILVGYEERIKEKAKKLGLVGFDAIEIHNARLSEKNPEYIDFLYARLQRKGFLRRDCQRMIHQDRNIFGAVMVASGDADAMVTGLTRTYSVSLKEVMRVLDPQPNCHVMGVTMNIAKGRTVFIGDTAVHETPTPEQLANIAIQAANKARQLGHEPRVAMLSFSNFGNPMRHEGDRIRAAVKILEAADVDFEFDGEMTADVALDAKLMQHYPFCKLSKPANILIMPGLHSAHISSKLLSKLGSGTVIGPLLIGMSKPVQIVSMGATVSDLVNAAVLAAHDADLSTPKPEVTPEKKRRKKRA